MKDSIRNKLEALVDRHEEISGLLSDPETMANQNKFRTLSQEYAQLEPVVKHFGLYLQTLSDLKDAQAMMQESDPEMREMAKEELAIAEEKQEQLAIDLQKLLLPKDPNDQRNIFLEVRAGTGGDEAAIFSGDLFRMYTRYAESRRWQVEVLNAQEGEHGGYKEIIARIVGDGAYSRLKFESGAHRVQRVPETESQGRIHTSACTVAICRKPMKSIRLKSTRPISKWIPFVLPVPVVSTLIQPIPPCVSRTYQPGLSLSVRKNVHNTKTAPKRCPFCSHASWRRKRKNKPPSRPKPADY